MAKISKLTQEQIARFSEFVEQWTRIGLCTEPADRRRAERAVRMMYHAAQLQEPAKIVWTTSPFAHVLTEHAVMALDKSVRARRLPHRHCARIRSFRRRSATGCRLTTNALG